MKTFAKLIAPVALLLAAPACAQTKPITVVRQAAPALWVVKDADTTIYLFGTVHLLPPGMKWFDKGLKKAFDSASEVKLEMVLPEPEEFKAIVLATALATDGVPLTEKLPAGKRAAFAAALASIGKSPTADDGMMPWWAANDIEIASIQKHGYELSNAPEGIITKAAADLGKPLSGLETAKQQLGYFHDLSANAQINFLTSVIDELPKLDATIDALVDDWAKGDTEAVGKLLNDDVADSPELEKVLLIDRNKRWADWIDQRMKQPGVVFMAVGAGHLAGRNSVLVQLRAHHLKAVRVRY